MFVVNLIISSIQNNLTKLSDFVSSNLVNACSLAEQLYKKVEEIKKSDEFLEGLEIELKELENRLANTSSTIPDGIDENGEPKTKNNPEYTNLKNQVNNKKIEITSQINHLEDLCDAADQLIGQIQALNGDSTTPSGASISLDSNYNNFFGDIDIESFIEEYKDDPTKLAEILAQNLRLPEGFTLLTKNFEEHSRYGITEENSGLIVKVRYKGISGTLYIPLDNGTTNLGIIMTGGSKDDRYSSADVHIFDENKFDSVVFIPNHNGNNEEAAYQNSDIKVLKEWVKSLQDAYGLKTITGNAHSNGCRDMTNLIIEWNKTEETKFSNVLLMNPSSNILYNQKVDIPTILKENNVTIETGAKDGYYADPQYDYVAKVVIDKYSSIGGGTFVQESTEPLKDIFESVNEAPHAINKHWCRWFTYLGGSFTDSNGKEITMKNLIDNE